MYDQQLELNFWSWIQHYALGPIDEMTFSMKNAFITISNDDRDILQQESNTNLPNILTNG